MHQPFPEPALNDFNKYQDRATSTAIYPGQGALLGLLYSSLGIGNEGGEILGKVKKFIRDSPPDVLNGLDGYPIEFRRGVGKELGDVLWYIAQICTELGLEMSVVAETNLQKLADRKERGVLGGSGDNR